MIVSELYAKCILVPHAIPAPPSFCTRSPRHRRDTFTDLLHHSYSTNGVRPSAPNPKFATIERYFYDTDKREILTSDGNPFQSRQMGTGGLARAPKVSYFK